MNACCNLSCPIAWSSLCPRIPGNQEGSDQMIRKEKVTWNYVDYISCQLSLDEKFLSFFQQRLCTYTPYSSNQQIFIVQSTPLLQKFCVLKCFKILSQPSFIVMQDESQICISLRYQVKRSQQTRAQVFKYLDSFPCLDT